MIKPSRVWGVLTARIARIPSRLSLDGHWPHPVEDGIWGSLSATRRPPTSSLKSSDCRSNRKTSLYPFFGFWVGWWAKNRGRVSREG